MNATCGENGTWKAWLAIFCIVLVYWSGWTMCDNVYLRQPQEDGDAEPEYEKLQAQIEQLRRELEQAQLAAAHLAAMQAEERNQRLLEWLGLGIALMIGLGGGGGLLAGAIISANHIFKTSAGHQDHAQIAGSTPSPTSKRWLRARQEAEIKQARAREYAERALLLGESAPAQYPDTQVARDQRSRQGVPAPIIRNDGRPTMLPEFQD